MNVLNEEIRALRVSIESKKNALKSVTSETEEIEINILISLLQEELENRLEKMDIDVSSN